MDLVDDFCGRFERHLVAAGIRIQERAPYGDGVQYQLRFDAGDGHAAYRLELSAEAILRGGYYHEALTRKVIGELRFAATARRTDPES